MVVSLPEVLVRSVTEEQSFGQSFDRKGTDKYVGLLSQEESLRHAGQKKRNSKAMILVDMVCCGCFVTCQLYLWIT